MPAIVEQIIPLARRRVEKRNLPVKKAANTPVKASNFGRDDYSSAFVQDLFSAQYPVLPVSWTRPGRDRHGRRALQVRDEFEARRRVETQRRTRRCRTDPNRRSHVHTK